MISLPNRLLVVVAHPDDEVLGCGATIAEVNSKGGSVLVLILGDGAMTPDPNQPALVERKQREAAAALAALGGGELRRGSLPDMQMGLLPPINMTEPIAAAISGFRPDWVLTHHHADLNADHRAVHEATRVCARPTSRYSMALMSMEVPSSSEYGYSAHEPNLVVPASRESLEAKCIALECYATEIRPYPHGRSTDAVRALAAFRGYTSNCEYAEAFRMIWARTA